jgi:hypothetical protein
MDNLSTAGISDMGSLIGALELGDHLASYGDGVLEKAGAANLGPTETNCGRNPTLVFRCVSDGALEAAGANTAMGPTQVNCGANPTTIMFRCVSDGALEAAGATMNPPQTQMVVFTRCQ